MVIQEGVKILSREMVRHEFQWKDLERYCTVWWHSLARNNSMGQ